MRPVLVLRPEPGASETARRVRALGWTAVIAPLFTVEPLAWEPPPLAAHDALMVTSANAVRMAGNGLERYRTLPAYAVGAASARALQDAGFRTVQAGEGDAEALLERLAAEGRKAPLHIAGAEVRDVRHERVSITRVAVYRAVAAAVLPEAAVQALAGGATVLLHSARAAETFAGLTEAAAISRRAQGIVALSIAVAEAAGSGWGAVEVATRPDDAALLAAAARLCEDEASAMNGRGA